MEQSNGHASITPRLRFWNDWERTASFCTLAAALACGAADEATLSDTLSADMGEEADVLETLAQSIVGGTLVGSAENGVVPIASAAKKNGGCSAVKIGPNRFLTAGHCLSPRATSVQITNSIDGTLSTTFSIPAGKALVHPSFKLRDGNQDDTVSSNVYDVAVFEVTSGPSFPATAVFAQGVGDNIPLTAVGYGKEAGTCPNTDGKKQKGAFTSKADGAGAFTDRHVHNIIDQGDPSGCGGDSGGPLFFGSGADARVVGVFSSVSRPAPPNLPLTLFTRLSNVNPWINDPIDSSQNPVSPRLLQNGSRVFLMNGSLSDNRPLLYCAAMTGTPPGVNPAGSVTALRSCDIFNGAYSGHFSGWQLVTSSEGGFKITNLIRPDLCLGIDPVLPVPSLARVKVLACSTSGAALRAQSWTFTAVAPRNDVAPDATAYNLRTMLSTSACLATLTGGGESGTELRMNSCGATEDRKWFVTR